MYDTECVSCKYEVIIFISLADFDWWKAICPECSGEMRRVIKTAPLTRVGGSGSDREINSMKRSFDGRFAKSGEMDQVRHKHGEEFDASIRAGAIGRARGKKKDHWSKD